MRDLNAVILKFNMMIYQRLAVMRVIDDMALVRNEDGDILRSDFEEKMERLDDFPLPKWSPKSPAEIRQEVIRRKPLLEKEIGMRLTEKAIEQYVDWARFH
jgi:hypothetical protein